VARNLKKIEFLWQPTLDFVILACNILIGLQGVTVCDRQTLQCRVQTADTSTMAHTCCRA